MGNTKIDMEQNAIKILKICVSVVVSISKQ